MARYLYMNDAANVGRDLILMDAVVAICCLLVMYHVYEHTRMEGFKICIVILSIALTIEQISINLGETHCHADALVMISKCSSLNSVCFYLPWMYSCWACGNRLDNLSVTRRALLVGLLHLLFCAPYELIGANTGLWMWGENVEALGDTLYEVPIMTFMFHFAFGAALVIALDFAKKYNQFGFFVEYIITICISQTISIGYLTFLGILENSIGVSRRILSIAILTISTVIVHRSLSNRAGNIAAYTVSSDYLLLSIPFGFLLFLLCINSRNGYNILKGQDELFYPSEYIMLTFLVIIIALPIFYCCCAGMLANMRLEKLS